LRFPLHRAASFARLHLAFDLNRDRGDWRAPPSRKALPIFGALAWRERHLPRAVACWLVFVVLTGLSLWCAYGTTATHLAVKFANQAVAGTALENAKTKLDRLRKQRDALQYVETSEGAVTTAQEALTAATAERIAECGEKNERRARSVSNRRSLPSAMRAPPWPRHT
jgi:hypothetical protein